MIEIYRREYGKDRLIRTFASWEEMFTRYISEESIKGTFGYTPTDLVLEYHRIFPDADRFFGDVLVSDNRHCYIAYEDGNLVTPDTLIGWHRYFFARRIRIYYHFHRRRGAYGGHRRLRTTHERRWAHAWDDEEYAPRTGFARGQRREHNLPNAWDDYYSQGQKSWKKQSKRLRQWRPKD